MNEKTVKYTFYAAIVITVFLTAYTLGFTRGDTETRLNVENDVPLDGETITETITGEKTITETTAVTVISWSEPDQKMVTTTVTNPVTTTIAGRTTWTTVQAPYFRVTITGWGRLLNENGDPINAEYLRSGIGDAENVIEDWQIEVRVRIQSNIANWNTGEIKLKIYVQDMSTGESARISWETDTPPYSGLNPTGDTVEFTDDWRDSIDDALDEIGGITTASRQYRFVFSCQVYQMRDIRTGEYIHDPGSPDEVKTDVGFSAVMYYSTTFNRIVVVSPVNEEESHGGGGQCIICVDD